MRLRKDGDTISHSINVTDVNSWRDEIMPVILIVYDALNEVAYWLYLQDYFENSPLFKVPQNRASMTIYLSKKNVVDQQAIALFRQFKEDIRKQILGVITHHV